MCERFTYQDVVAVIGEDAGDALIANFGGTHIDIPAKARPGAVFDELCGTIGEDAARKLVLYCGSLPLSIPRNAARERQERDMRIVAKFDELTAAGMTARKAVKLLAVEFRLVESTVWRIFKRAP